MQFSKKYIFYPLVATLLLLNFTACGGAPEEGDSISPSKVTSNDLEGYWYNEETQTVLAFQTAKDAYWDTFTWLNTVFDEPISTAWYLHTSGGSPSVQQAATWSVSDGNIKQTVLAEANGLFGDKGTQYSTKITEFRNRRSMTLESGKTFTYGETCADHTVPGKFTYRATIEYGSEGNQACTGTNFVGYAAMAIDPQGGVHTVTTVADNNLSVRGTSLRPCTPLASSWDGGCDARRWPIEYSDGQALSIDPDTMTVHSLHSVDVDGAQGKVVYRIRKIGDGEDVEPFTVIDPLPGSKQVKMMVYARGETGTVVIDNTIFRREGRTFTQVTPTLPDIPQPVNLANGTFGPDGRIYTLSNSNLFIETEPAVFEVVPLPRINRDNGLGFNVAVGQDGVVHVLYPYDISTTTQGAVLGGVGVYARYENGTWQEVELGRIGRSKLAVTETGEPILLHALAKGSDVSYVLTRILPDGKRETELVIGGSDNGGTLDNWVVPTLAVGNGRVAYSSKGVDVGVANIDELFDPNRARATSPFTLNIEGSGKIRVVSDDGRVDCTETCTVDLPQGRYTYMTATPGEGTLIQGANDGPLSFGIMVGPEPASHTIHMETSVTGRIIGIGERIVGRSEESIIMATDDEKIAMLVRSPDADFHYDQSILTAPAPSPYGVYIVTGTLAAATKLRAVNLNLDIDPLLARLTPTGDLELIYLLERARTIGDTTYGTNNSSALVRVLISDEGTIKTSELLMDFATIVGVLGSAGNANGTQALFIEGQSSLTDPETTRRAFVIIDERGATLHTFDDNSIGGVPSNFRIPNQYHHIDVANDAVLVATDGLIAYVVDGTKRWEITTNDIIVGIDANGPAPTILVSTPGNTQNSRDQNARVITLDPTTGAISNTINLEIPAVGDLMSFDARPEAGYMMWRRDNSSTDRNVEIQVYDPSIDKMVWKGGFDIRRITRTTDGRTWLEAKITYTSGQPSFQTRQIADRQSFLIEMRSDRVVRDP